jgi:anti-anti-sigma regulatory factor
VIEVDGDCLRVGGEVDAGAAGTLRGLLVGVTGGGSLPAVVDLADVTHLGSAGVQVLHELAGADSGVRLRAPYGSVAQHVLTLACLPVEG